MTVLAPRRSSAALLNRLLDMPDLAPEVRALPEHAFAALVRHVGAEDAGELLALATTPQLVAAFDDDLFTSDRPGADERFDTARFAAWLDAMREAGDEAMAARFAELDEDFVTSALSKMLVVLDEAALRERFEEVGEEAGRRADKALDGALSEEIDGYVLVAREHEGWDAVLALVLALDRDHRELLVRVLDRCAALDAELLGDLDDLADVLTASASLEDDVAQAREERRAKLGYVTPEAARAFLALARKPLARGEVPARDVVTKAALRDVERTSTAAASVPVPASPHLLAAVQEATAEAVDDGHPLARRPGRAAEPKAFAALRALRETDPRASHERMEEIAYLANVLVAGASKDGRKPRPAEASEAVLAMVWAGASLVARDHGGDDLVAVLATHAADLLFRRACGAVVVAGGLRDGIAWSEAEAAERLAL